MFELNSLVFASPRCTYSSSSLFKTLIYIPAPHGQIPCIFLQPHEDVQQRENFQKHKVMLYFHGNAEDLGNTYQYMIQIRQIFGFRIIAMEYRGYGIY